MSLMRPSLSARRAWIEIVSCCYGLNLQHGGSLSARRAWIEIAGSLDDILAGVVALRKESVDRNPGHEYNIVHNRFGVALRKESVDRNAR